MWASPSAAGSARSAPRRLWSTAKRTLCSPWATPWRWKERSPAPSCSSWSGRATSCPGQPGTSLSLPYYGTRLGGGRDEGLLRAWRFGLRRGVVVAPHGGTPCRTRHGHPGRGAAELRLCSGRLWRGYGRHVRRRRRGPRRAQRGGRFRGAGGPLLRRHGHHRCRIGTGERQAPRLRDLGDARAWRDAGELRGVGAWSVDGPARRGRHDEHKGRARARRVHAGLRRGDGDGGAQAPHPPTLGGLCAEPRAVAWREKPSTYVVCTEDRATPPDAQRGYARKADRVVELLTGHHPMLSRPELLAQVLAEAV